MNALDILRWGRAGLSSTIRGISEQLGIDRFSRPGLNDLDRKLAQYLDFSNGFFVECGANDGFRQSNTYYLERFKGWTGVLIEPVPELHQRCERLRRGATSVRAALVGPDFPHDSIQLEFAGLMTAAEGAFGDQNLAHDHVRRGLELQRLKPKTIRAPAVTFSALMDSLGIGDEIDFFSLDVEGYELEVLAGIDFRRHRPRFLLVEARDPRATRTLLANDYREVAQLTHHDYLFAAS